MAALSAPHTARCKFGIHEQGALWKGDLKKRCNESEMGFGAGDGNRTRVSCLEGRGSTIELHRRRRNKQSGEMMSLLVPGRPDIVAGIGGLDTSALFTDSILSAVLAERYSPQSNTHDLSWHYLARISLPLMRANRLGSALLGQLIQITHQPKNIGLICPMEPVGGVEPSTC